ncbi:hypothetical protein PWT90_03081 [Aphanocladium album]|nr:hypothetical protein PWT90_03081 [Aphanocladium album]
MFRSLVAGTFTAMICGLSTAMACSMIWGTATLPFVLASSVGFALGSIRWYIISTKEALLQLHRYPALLRMHIIMNFPWFPEYSRHGTAWFTQRKFSRDWIGKSILIAAWLSAQPALEDIQTQAEAALVQEYTDNGGNEKDEDEE